MKIFAAITTAAVFLTSPMSAAAQTSEYDLCVGRCEEAYGNHQGYCSDRYGGGIDYYYCELAIGQEHDGCLQSCNGLEGAQTGVAYQGTRFRPSEIIVSHNAI